MPRDGDRSGSVAVVCNQPGRHDGSVLAATGTVLIELQFPEFLLLAAPIAFCCWRWGNFRPAWIWLAPAALWGAAALWLWTPPIWAHLVLLAPLALWLAPYLRSQGITGALRLAAVTLLLFALTGPEWNLGGRGIDVIVVADRSRSMPAAAEASVLELLQNIETNRRAGDRVAVVTFGHLGIAERGLSADAMQGSKFIQTVGADGSDLNAGLLAALNLVDRNRPARILVLSDGEANGPSPNFAARRARELGVPIDYRWFEVLRTGDIAIRELSLPEQVGPLEPFQFTVEVYADRAATAELTISRDGTPFVTREVDLLPGANRVPFRDVLAQGGLRSYVAELKVDGDPLIANNRGEGLVRVEAGPRLLVLNNDGQPDNLVRALTAAQLPVDVQAASAHELTQDSLDGYRAVIIENVPAGDFGRLKLERLAQFVEDLGGGLLVTGGQRSFGVGGYFQSPLDNVLPVSMEMREEHRKTRIAIAIALDRSGSMAAPVPGGKTKMDLANLGTAAVVRLLSPGDSVAVIAVDSSPHVIQPLTPVTDAEAIAQRVLNVESMGGGIFVYEALVAAGSQIANAEQATKHIVLFSDASDSEEPGAYVDLLKKYEAAGITVSVIGLGTIHDPDAKLLEDIAKRGKGNILFTEDPKELPRLFTEDTMSVARSTFIEKDPETQPDGIGGQLLTNARLMGDLWDLAPGGAFPTSDGYNLCYLRPDATAAVQSTDEYAAPWAAFWHRKLGRAAAITLEVDGKFSGQFGRWDRFDDFLITHARWLMGEQSAPEIYFDLQRSGQDAVLRVELDPQRTARGDSVVPQVMVVPPGDDRAAPLKPDLVWTGPNSLEARFRLDRTGSYRTLVVQPATATGQPPRFQRGPAVTLPYSPEFDPREATQSGREILAEVAEVSGGTARTDVLEVLRDPPRSARTVSMLPWLFGSVLCLLLLEIAGRRLSLWEQLGELLSPASEPATSSPSVARQSRRWGAGWLSRASNWRRRASRKAAAQATSAAAESAATAATPAAPAPAPPSQPPAATPPAIDVFAAAKQRARRRNQ